MKYASLLVQRLRRLHRGYKFAILLIAAWAPFVSPENPAIGGLLMGSMTALFFLATGPKTAIDPAAGRPALPEVRDGHP